jgi:AcrR family transcriptional regulator
MSEPPRDGRENQRKRTRKAILEAAARLAGAGRTPTLEEVAEEALVSRATAYRYFPSIDALMVEAALDIAFPDAQALLADAPDDVAIRLERLERAFHAMVYGHEPMLRSFLALSIGLDGEGSVRRQNRRVPFIALALEPVRAALGPARFDRLTKAIAILTGTESMIVCTDVLRIDADEALAVKLWAIHALVAAALAEGGRAESGRAEMGLAGPAAEEPQSATGVS